MSLRNKLNHFMQKLTGYKLIGKDLDIHLQLILDEKYGHKNSRISQSSVDENNNPIPWITYPAFEYINQLDLSDKEIFEWGSGNSSLYFAKRCKQIVSVETDRSWYEEVLKNCKSNMELLYVERENAAKAIQNFEKKFDIILIDSGSNRLECAQQAIQFLKEGGVIILDNSARFQKASKALKDKKLLQVDMHGFSPINKYTSTTSLFFDRTFDFKSNSDRQPTYSKASLKDYAE